MSEADGRTDRAAQLDGLRALAVLAVLYFHFWDQGPPWGHQGVRLFFVLSGFLITRILIEPRDGGGGKALVSFYARRALRIFPAYYLVVLASAALSPEVRATAPWHLTFTSNIRIALSGEWRPLAHLWTLSVEEQFYLLWAPFVLFSPRRLLLPAAIVLAAAAPVFRVVALAAEPNGLAADVLLPGSMDALGIGAVMAILEGAGRLNRLGSRLLTGLAAAGLVLAFLASVSGLPRLMTVGWIDTLVTAGLAAAVLAGARGRLVGVGALLSWGPVRRLGVISYGVYLYHLVVQSALLRTPVPALREMQAGPFQFFVCTGASVAVAAVSWRLLERPLNELKRHFPYARPGSSPKSSPGLAVEPG